MLFGLYVRSFAVQLWARVDRHVTDVTVPVPPPQGIEQLHYSSF
jgi:hypothetical protein